MLTACGGQRASSERVLDYRNRRGIVRAGCRDRIDGHWIIHLRCGRDSRCHGIDEGVLHNDWFGGIVRTAQVGWHGTVYNTVAAAASGDEQGQHDCRAETRQQFSDDHGGLLSYCQAAACSDTETPP